MKEPNPDKTMAVQAKLIFEILLNGIERSDDGRQSYGWVERVEKAEIDEVKESRRAFNHGQFTQTSGLPAARQPSTER